MQAFSASGDRAMALADCNNFFVSCERRADDSLDNRPVVVLSCNDGCVISRSNEVKKMGIKMGEPYFKIKNILAYNGVAVRSNNMRLYQRISSEVMARLKLYTDAIEQYSIDESFFNMAIATVADPVAYCLKIRRDIWRTCRIPVSIGIAPTKTLCKLGTDYAKRHEETGGVYWMDASRYGDSAFMSQFECGDIWGIGRKSAARLAKLRVMTAADFMKKDDLWLKKNFSITAMYTSWELKGHPAFDLSRVRKAQKTILVSRSFGNPLTLYDELLDPLLCFAVSAAKQLRRANMSAKRMTVFISTSRFNEGDKYYSNSKEIYFQEPKRLDSDFIDAAKEALKAVYAAGYKYKRCGVVLSDFTDTSAGTQAELFHENGALDEKRLKAAEAYDTINREFHGSVVKPAALFAAPDDEKKWTPRSEFRSDGRKSATGTDSPLPDGLRFQTHAHDCVT